MARMREELNTGIASRSRGYLSQEDWRVHDVFRAAVLVRWSGVGVEVVSVAFATPINKFRSSRGRAGLRFL